MISPATDPIQSHKQSPIKLVALDLDGTVVNHDLQISPKVRQILRHLVEQTDVKVVLATGRMLPSTLPFAVELGMVDPIVTYQGGMITQLDLNNTVIDHKTIPPSLAHKVLKLLETRPCHVNVYIDNVLYTKPHDEFVEEYARISGVMPTVVPDPAALVTNLGPTKLMAIHDTEEDTQETLRILQAKIPLSQLNSCVSRYNFLEMIHPSTSKWAALEILCKQWGIQPNEVMAVGDHGNDLSMIEGAGIGVAMGHAPSFVKEKANHITGTLEEDGVAQAIEQFVLV